MAAVYKNLLGTMQNEFSLGKGNNRVDFRTNAGITEYRNNGGGWSPIGVGGISNLSTGLITTGNIMSVNGGDNTRLDLTALKGLIIDSTTDVDNQTMATVEKLAVTAYNPANTAGAGDVIAIYISVDSIGTIVERLVPPTAEEARNTIDIGLIVRNDADVIVDVINTSLNAVHNPGSSMQDFIRTHGGFSKSGNIISENATDLEIKKTAGEIFSLNANFSTNPKNPHSVTNIAQTPITFGYKLSDGTDTNLTATDIDPNNYDDGSSTPAAVPAGKFTVQRISMFAEGHVEILYGQQVFDLLSEAKSALPTLDTTTPADSVLAIPLSYLIVRQGTTDLSVEIDREFFKLNRFGEIGGLGFQQLNSAGMVYDPGLTDNGNGTIDIGNGLVNLFLESGFTGDMKQYSLAGLTAQALTDLDTNYVVADYNSGSPIFRVTLNVLEINESDVVPVYTIYRSGNILEVLRWGEVGSGLVNKLHARFVKTDRFGYESGVILGEVATRTITSTSGVIWVGGNRTLIPAANSSTDSCEFWYHVAGVWTKSDVTQYNNTQYDDGTDLQNLGAPNFGSVFVYQGIENDAHLYYVLGQDNYTLSEAQVSQPPSNPPEVISSHAVLIGRIVIGSDDAVATQIDSAFTTQFIGTPITDHENLSNVLGGAPNNNQHYALYTTVVLAQAATTQIENNLIYVGETLTNYRYEPNGAAYTVNGTAVLSTGNGGDTRFLAVGGQYNADGKTVYGKINAIGDGSSPVITSASYGANPAFRGYRANGSVALPTGVLDTNVLSDLQARGHDTAGDHTSGVIRFIATEDWTDTEHGTKLEFYLANIGEDNPTIQMVLEEDILTVNGGITALTDGSSSIITAKAYGGAGRFRGYRANGTEAVPTAILDNDIISDFQGVGFDGTDDAYASRIWVRATENWTNTEHGVKMDFVITNIGEDTSYVAMTLEEGNLGIGVDTPIAPLHVVRTVTDTDIVRAPAIFHTTTSGDMVDGFGTGFTFRLEDDTSGAISSGFIGVVRDGADDESSMVFHTNSGTVAERMRLSSDTLTASGNITALADGSATVMATAHGASARFSGYRANGTIAVPTAITNSDIIADFRAIGFDGTDDANAGRIWVRATEDWTDTEHGVKMDFVITNVGEDSAHAVMTLEEDTLTMNGDITAIADGSSAITVKAHGASARLSGYRANGTIAAPTAILDDDIIADFRALGFDGTDDAYPGRIWFRATENWTDTEHGTKMEVVATNNGDNNSHVVMILEEDNLTLPEGKVNANSYTEKVNIIGSIGGGTQDVDLDLGGVVTGTVDTSTTTFTFSNPAPSGTACSFTLILTNANSQTINWPASVSWPSGNAPALTLSGVDVLTFMTVDGGTIWHGFVASEDSK